MPQLLGPNGRPISSSKFKKSSPPKFGAVTDHAGRQLHTMTLPGGALLQFDLDKLELSDYRAMRDHYQVNSSLILLSFMLHQSEWHLEGGTAKARSIVEEQLKKNWTTLNRALSTSNWAGFSPCALEWRNDVDGRAIVLDSVKDLFPEECRVNWKEIDGYAPAGRPKPKVRIYDGIKHFSRGYPIPKNNTLWHPLLMENGDYYGKKPLRPAYMSYFFSMLLHMYANRYFERFGEPVPMGRAPFDEEVTVDGEQVTGNVFMLDILRQLRNRSVVVLPNDGTYDNNGKKEYDYNLSFLESQMRGADFERYMTRLDEEISIGLFTPILMMRTADVGSYNLGVGHTSTYLTMLNALNADRAQYVQSYIIRRIVDFNFSEKAEAPTLVFRKLGNTNQEMLSTILQVLLTQGKAKIDLREIGQYMGLTISEVKEMQAPDGTGEDLNPADVNNLNDPSNKPKDKENPKPKNDRSPVRRLAKETIESILGRLEAQIENAYARDKVEETKFKVGFIRQTVRLLSEAGSAIPEAEARSLYSIIDSSLEEAKSVMGTGDEFKEYAKAVVTQSISDAAAI